MAEKVERLYAWIFTMPSGLPGHSIEMLRFHRAKPLVFTRQQDAEAAVEIARTALAIKGGSFRLVCFERTIELGLPEPCEPPPRKTRRKRQ